MLTIFAVFASAVAVMVLIAITSLGHRQDI